MYFLTLPITQGIIRFSSGDEVMKSLESSYDEYGWHQISSLLGTGTCEIWKPIGLTYCFLSLF